MSKLFDSLEKVVFNTVNAVYGTILPAVWVSFDGSVSFSGTVLFNNPTSKESLDQMAFMEADPYMEYLDPAFPGLKQFVDTETGSERVVIDGITYIVTEVQRLRDGNNYKAYLQPVGDGYGPKNQ